MLVAAAVGGLALSLSNPATNRVIVAAFPPGQRGAALGWKQAGVPLAALLAGPTVPSVAAAVGWRGALVAIAVASLFTGGLATYVLRHVTQQKAAAPRVRVVRGEGRSLRWLNELGFLMGAATGCVNTYLVLYGVEALQYDERVAGLLIAVVGPTSTVTRVVWASRAERGSGPHTSLRVMGPVSVVAALIIAAAPYWGGWLLWIGAVLAGVGIFIFTSLGMLALVQAVPQGSVGLVTGSLSRTFFAGLLAGPLSFGLVVDLTDGYTWSWLIVAALAVGATVITYLPRFLLPVRMWPDQPP